MNTKDYTYHKLKYMIKYNEIAVFKSDKGSSIVTINKNDYGKKFEEMIKALIRKGVHEASRNTNFSKFQSIICRNIKILE